MLKSEDTHEQRLPGSAGSRHPLTSLAKSIEASINYDGVLDVDCVIKIQGEQADSIATITRTPTLQKRLGLETPFQGQSCDILCCRSCETHSHAELPGTIRHLCCQSALSLAIQQPCFCTAVGRSISQMY